ncbi:hypothetical protein ACHAXT_013341 [Thalassiosira profunda]
MFRMGRRSIFAPLIASLLLSGGASAARVGSDQYRTAVIEATEQLPKITRSSARNDTVHSDPGHPAIDAVIHTFELTRELLKTMDWEQIKLTSAAGFFDLLHGLLHHPYMVMNSLACFEIVTMLVGGQANKKRAVLSGKIVDKLFKEHIVDRVLELALSDNEREMEMFTIGPKATSKIQTVKEDASKAVMYIAMSSKRKHIRTLVDAGARDAVCHLAKTTDNKELVLYAMEAASRLGFAEIDDNNLGGLTITSIEDIAKYAQLCGAMENFQTAMHQVIL